MGETSGEGCQVSGVQAETPEQFVELLQKGLILSELPKFKARLEYLRRESLLY